MVTDWSGTTAQLLISDVLLEDIAGNNTIPTLSEIKSVYGSKPIISIIVSHILSVYKFAGIDIESVQESAIETAALICSNYWYLNLAEVARFFNDLKSGVYGQFVWGSRVNNQQVLVCLSDFIGDRRRAIERVEKNKAETLREKGFCKVDAAAAAMITGVETVKELRDRAITSFNAFTELFPNLPDTYSPDIWWHAWNGSGNALKIIYKNNLPDKEVAKRDIGCYLCDYNIRFNSNV